MNVKLISGKKLQIILKKKGIKQNDLVEITGIAQEQISRYFNDKNAMPASFIIQVAFYAGMKLDDLIEGTIEPNTIDITYTDVAAEPQVQYITAPKVPELPEAKEDPKDLVIIDVSGLTKIIDNLREQIDHVEQTVMDLKEGKFTVNQ